MFSHVFVTKLNLMTLIGRIFYVHIVRDRVVPKKL